MKCAECEFCKATYHAKSTQNNLGMLPRRGFSCKHKLATEFHRKMFPRTNRTIGFIGFSKMGEVYPDIKTHPKWCPLRKK